VNIASEFLKIGDPVNFARSLGLEPDPWQAKLLKSKAKRMILACGRQVGKTTAVGIYAYYYAKVFRNSEIIMISKSLRQSQLLFRKVRQAVDAEQSVLHIDHMNLTDMELKNGSRIIAIPGSADSVRGFSGPKLVIFDEAAYIEDRLFYAVTPMVAASDGTIIMLSSPGAKSGFFWNVWSKGGDEWERYRVRAEECPRIAEKFLAEERGRMLDHVFRREYEAEFTESSEALVSEDDIQASHSQIVRPLIANTLITDNVSRLQVVYG
jgi:hypothetical protein